MGVIEDTYIDRRANRMKKQEKLIIEMIGSKKKKEKNQTRLQEKSNGQLMKREKAGWVEMRVVANATNNFLTPLFP